MRIPLGFRPEKVLPERELYEPLTLSRCWLSIATLRTPSAASIILGRTKDEKICPSSQDQKLFPVSQKQSESRSVINRFPARLLLRVHQRCEDLSRGKVGHCVSSFNSDLFSRQRFSERLKPGLGLHEAGGFCSGRWDFS